MRRFDIALVGCGGVSSMHLEGWKRHPERVRLVAACDPDEARAARRAQDYGIPRTFPSVEAMIAGADWEVVAVCTPTAVREPIVRALAAGGKHILVEKPLADSYQEAERMAAACRDAGVHLAVDQNFRYHYPFHVARQVIESDRLGRALGIVHQDLMLRQDSGWRIERPRHALSVMGVHWLDGFRWALGREAASLVCQAFSSPSIQCAGETDAFVQIAFEGGATAQYVESFSCPTGRVETLIVGERAWLKMGYGEAALFDAEHRAEPVERWTNPYAGDNKPESSFQCLENLLTALEQGGAPSNSGEDNLKTIALLEGAYQSAQSGTTVRFQEGRLA